MNALLNIKKIYIIPFMTYNFKDRNLLNYENKILNNIIIHISLYNLKCDHTQIIRMKSFKYYILY